MRLKKREWAILSIPLIVTGLLLAGSGPQASSRLVSVQHIPETLQWCDESTDTAPKSRLVTHTKGNIEIWKVPKVPMEGESTEPPVKIPAPLGRQSGDIEIVLDPIHKEVIIATAAGNAVMTFSVPEVFD